MKKINIAIDGPSASGKGVTAKKLAELLNYNYLDTGAMYRAIGYFMISNNITLNTFDKTQLNQIEITFNSKNHVVLNGEDIEDKIRNAKVSKYASDFSKLKEVREFLVKKQKEIVRKKGFIADGRDIGSVVIPDAEVKIFLVAELDIRAERRLKEYLEKGESVTYEEVKKQIYDRDFQDINRKESPLKKTKDAIELNTSYLSIDEQVKKIYDLVLKKIEEKNRKI